MLSDPKGKEFKILTLKTADQPSNPCIRCGQQRIVLKTWQEPSGDSFITHTTTACPDAACQKIVDRQLASQKQKKEAMEFIREQRRELAKSTAEANRLVKKT